MLYSAAQWWCEQFPHTGEKIVKIFVKNFRFCPQVKIFTTLAKNLKDFLKELNFSSAGKDLYNEGPIFSMGKEKSQNVLYFRKSKDFFLYNWSFKEKLPYIKKSFRLHNLGVTLLFAFPCNVFSLAWQSFWKMNKFLAEVSKNYIFCMFCSFCIKFSLK